ncbi:MAG: hypothetical protein CMH78_02800 [Nitrospinae bacterium]|jgi:integrase|nr:hypothetical protein [Nitrospinota bacterium]MDP7580113.1 hypothetical protein [Nitrospinota bacterium]|tara:strand:+ start:952 stop:2586 length:1635 start_codon:yes stop_codon:yes gene_type:complete
MNVSAKDNMNLQFYTLDQLNELVRVGLITIPVDNTLTSKPEKHFIPEASYNIIAYQTKPFTFITSTERGKEVLRIGVHTIRDHKRPWLWKCLDCGLEFKHENEFQCRKHRRQAPQVKLRIFGLNEPELPPRVDIYSDLDNNQLSLNNIHSIKKRMEDEVKRKTFNIWRYLPRKKKKFIFENYVPAYLEDLKRRSELNHNNIDLCSIAHYKDVCFAFKNHLIPFLKNYDIAEIKKGVINDFRNSLNCPASRQKKNKTPSSILCGKTLVDGICSCGFKIDEINKGFPKSSHQKRKFIGYLLSLFSWAKDREDIAIIPHYTVPELERVKKQGITLDIQQEIFDQIPEKHQPIFDWYREIGLRPGEVPAFKIEDIDFDKPVYLKGKITGYGIFRRSGAFDRGRYKPFPKNKKTKGEEHPLSDKGKEILKRAMTDRIFRKDEFLFINPDTKRHYYYKSLQTIFAKAKVSAGYPEVTLYAWGCHTKAQELLEGGASFEQVGLVIGKSAYTVEKSYASPTAGIRKDIEKKFGAKNQKKFAKVINLSGRKQK